MNPGLSVSSIPQCKSNRHEEACLELLQAMGRGEATCIEAHQASKMICKVRSLISWIQTHTFWEEIMTSSDEVLKDFESDMAVGIRKMGNPTWETTKRYVIRKQNAGT